MTILGLVVMRFTRKDLERPIKVSQSLTDTAALVSAKTRKAAISNVLHPHCSAAEHPPLVSVTAYDPHRHWGAHSSSCTEDPHPTQTQF